MATIVTAEEMSDFNGQFIHALEVGQPLTHILSDLQQQQPNPQIAQALAGVRADILTGHRLSDAMAKHPSVFSPDYTALVKRGEEGGNLDEVLQQAA